eukprot:jgi/Mesen1/4361/ME000022S03653
MVSGSGLLQVERTVLFFLEEQGLLASKLQRLREQRESLQEAGNVSEFPALMESYRQVGAELLQLLQFVAINATGIRKILKKFDRKVGSRLGEAYITSRTNHPYSQLQQVFRHVGLGAMVGTILRNLQELHDRQIQAAHSNLTEAVSYSSFLSNSLLLPPKPSRGPLGGIPEEEGKEGKEAAGEEYFHWWSLQLNQLNTFLYMVNYYIIVPSSDDYAVMLRAPSTLCGVIIGCTPLMAMVSAWVYSKWSNRSYRAPLVVSTLVLMVGNLSYAMALDLGSVWLLLIGRALEGLGGARAINRRYIADHVPLERRTHDSAAFVSASALGMAAGPFIAGLTSSLSFKALTCLLKFATLIPLPPPLPCLSLGLPSVCDDCAPFQAASSMMGFTVNYATLPGWLMFGVWTAYLVLLLVAFKEPPHHPPPPPTPSGAAGSKSASTSGSSDLEQRLLADAPHEGAKEEKSKSSGQVESWAGLKKEMTAPVQLLLLVYFMIKFAQEVLVSESGVVAKYYFSWTTSQVGSFLACLGLTVLPVSAVVGHYVSNIFEDRLVIWWTQIVTLVGVLASLSFSPWVPYTHTQYIGSAIIVFVTCNVTEGVTMALLAKVMSPKLAQGTFNCGFLSTEAGTFARVVGDGLITVAGSLGSAYVLNLTMLPVLGVAVISLLCTQLRYYSLY